MMATVPNLEDKLAKNVSTIICKEHSKHLSLVPRPMTTKVT